MVMARTINEAFRKLRENLEITGLQEATVSTRQTNVRATLDDDFVVEDSFPHRLLPPEHHDRAVGAS